MYFDIEYSRSHDDVSHRRSSPAAMSHTNRASMDFSITSEFEFQNSPSVSMRNSNLQHSRDSPVYHSHDRYEYSSPISFDGHGSWEAFHAEFTSYANKWDWDDQQKIKFLCRCLEREARDYCKFLLEREPDIFFHDLVYCLKERFSLRNLAHSKFVQAVQNDDETRSEWAERVMRLATHAFPDRPRSFIQSQAINIFCTGVLDVEAGEFAAESEPKTLDEALYLVRLYRDNSRCTDEESRTTSYHSEFSSSEVNQEVCHVPSTRAKTQCNNFSEQVTKLENVVQKQESQIIKLEKEFHDLQLYVSSLEDQIAKHNSSQARIDSLASEITFLKDSFTDEMNFILDQVETLQNLVHSTSWSVRELKTNRRCCTCSCNCRKLDEAVQCSPYDSSDILMPSVGYDRGNQESTIIHDSSSYELNYVPSCSFKVSPPSPAENIECLNSPSFTKPTVDEADISRLHLDASVTREDTSVRQTCVTSPSDSVTGSVSSISPVFDFGPRPPPETDARSVPPVASSSHRFDRDRFATSTARGARTHRQSLNGGDGIRPHHPCLACRWVLPPWPPPS